MKKFFALLLAIVTIISFVACNDDASSLPVSTEETNNSIATEEPKQTISQALTTDTMNTMVPTSTPEVNSATPIETPVATPTLSGDKEGKQNNTQTPTQNNLATTKPTEVIKPSATKNPGVVTKAPTATTITKPTVTKAPIVTEKPNIGIEIPTIIASTTEVFLEDSSQTVQLTVKNIGDATLKYEIENGTIAECLWWGWTGETTALEIFPKNKGNTKIRVYIESTNIYVDINVSVYKPIETYAVGETWTVNEQWNFTVDSVTTHYLCDSFVENCQLVIIVEYTYENIGYSETSALYFAPEDFKIGIDNERTKIEDSKPYPCEHTKKYEPCMTGRKCTASAVFLLSNDSSYITVDVKKGQYMAQFNLKVEKSPDGI